MTQKYYINNKYEVLTEDGFKDFAGLNQKAKNSYYKLYFSDQSILQCSIDHKIKLINGKFKQAKNIKCNKDITSNNLFIIKKQIIRQKVNVYDLIDVQDTNQYITQNVTSHNCGNVFHRLWTQAVQNLNGLNPIQLQWYLRPDRDQQWYIKQKAKYGKKGFAQQYQCSFEASGDNVVQMQTIHWYQDNYMIQPITRQQANRMWVFKYPEKDKSYLLAADVARGDGGDYSAFHIIELDNLQQVAQFKGKIGTKQYAQIINKWAKLYFDAMIVVQNASIGWAVLQNLIDNSAKNLYYTQKDVSVVQNKTLKYVSKPTDSTKGVPGFTTSSKTRPLITQKLTRFIQQHAFIIRSKRTLTQLITFIWSRGGKCQAMAGYNDDLVMSAAIGVWVRQTAIKARQKSRKKTRDLLRMSGKTLTNAITTGYQQRPPWLIQLADGTIIDTRNI